MEKKLKSEKYGGYILEFYSGNYGMYGKFNFKVNVISPIGKYLGSDIGMSKDSVFNKAKKIISKNKETVKEANRRKKG